jgi:hypothetical protein
MFLRYAILAPSEAAVRHPPANHSACFDQNVSLQHGYAIRRRFGSNETTKSACSAHAYILLDSLLYCLC